MAAHERPHATQKPLMVKMGGKLRWKLEELATKYRLARSSGDVVPTVQVPAVHVPLVPAPRVTQLLRDKLLGEDDPLSLATGGKTLQGRAQEISLELYKRLGTIAIDHFRTMGDFRPGTSAEHLAFELAWLPKEFLRVTTYLKTGLSGPVVSFLTSLFGNTPEVRQVAEIVATGGPELAQVLETLFVENGLLEDCDPTPTTEQALELRSLLKSEAFKNQVRAFERDFQRKVANEAWEQACAEASRAVVSLITSWRDNQDPRFQRLLEAEGIGTEDRLQLNLHLPNGRWHSVYKDPNYVPPSTPSPPS